MKDNTSHELQDLKTTMDIINRNVSDTINYLRSDFKTTVKMSFLH